VEEGINGLAFQWADVDTLTSHLHRLATDRGLTRRMGAASRDRAARFPWNAAAEQYLAMFEQAAATSPAMVRDRGLLVMDCDRT
jgi:hypothetical protein